MTKDMDDDDLRIRLNVESLEMSNVHIQAHCGEQSGNCISKHCDCIPHLSASAPIMHDTEATILPYSFEH
jgi:hypothetical protein